MKILIICPEFNDYEKRIHKGFENLGYKSTLIKYRESSQVDFGFFLRLCLKVNISLLWRMYLFFYDEKKLCPNFNSNILKYDNNEFDILLVVKGLGLQKNTINRLKAKKKILYQWDSIGKIPLVTNVYSSFDRVFTFDVVDSSKGYGEYLENFSSISSDSVVEKYKYDLFFVGVYNKWRYKQLIELQAFCRRTGLTSYFKLIDESSFIKKDGMIIISEPLIRDDYESKLMSSKAIVELAHPNQNGYTQRFFDALSAKKLIIDFNSCNDGSNNFKNVIKNSELYNMNDSDVDMLFNDYFNEIADSLDHTVNDVESWIQYMINFKG